MTRLASCLWIVDTPLVAIALAQTLAERLDGAVRPFFPSAPPDECCQTAVVEILLPDCCGLSWASRMRDATGASVAVWGMQPSPLHAWVAWRIGFNGCLDKNSTWDETVGLLHAFQQGACVWPPQIWLDIQHFDSMVGRRLEQLNRTDWVRWLDLIQGLCNKELARRWRLSLRGTAKAKDRLLNKLEVGTALQAATLAWSTGMVRVTQHPVWTDAVTLYQVHQKHIPSFQADPP